MRASPGQSQATGKYERLKLYVRNRVLRENNVFFLINLNCPLKWTINE